jgi:serine/threonine protein kinase
MARPETVQEVVALARQSGLVGEPDLDRLAHRLPADAHADTAFTLLVADGLLTPYQAEELAVGQWRGFWMGAYKVLDRLGKGGMGHVFLAEHAVLRKRVAVKVLSAGLRSDPAARRRFVREARAAASVDHPNVVHVFDVDMDHDPPYLVMEFVDGLSLQAAVSRTGTFAAGEAAAVGVEVARGLVAAAAAGLVHRDVKPANLLVDRRGGVKILDLGIVRLPGDDTLPKTEDPDVILGTLDYLAPEQALNATEVDGRADLYALGATLYFLLAGHPPFPGSDVRHKLAAKQYSDPPPVHRLRPDVDAGLAGVIQALLCRDPAGRYQTAAEAVAALQPFAQLRTDFPGRLFRPERSSTAHDAPAGRQAPLPATQRILRPTPRETPAALPPQPPKAPAAEDPPTDRLLKAGTEPTIPAMVAVTPAPAETLVVPPAPAETRPPRRAVWVFPLFLVAAAALTAALAAFARP